MDQPEPIPKTVTIGKRTFTLLFPHLLRPLQDNERQTLKNSIRKTGVVVPVVVDESDGVIDGINRLMLAAEVGIVNVPVTVRDYLTDEQKVELALTLNDARRHLTPAQRKRLKEDRDKIIAEARARGLSTRAIAEETGLPKSTVADSACSIARPRAIEHPGPPLKVLTSDGKTYPAQRLDPERRDERDDTIRARREEGVPVRQIAQELGVSVGTVAGVGPAEAGGGDEDDLTAGDDDVGDPAELGDVPSPERVPADMAGLPEQLRHGRTIFARAKKALEDLRAALEEANALPWGAAIQHHVAYRKWLRGISGVIDGCGPFALGCPECDGTVRSCFRCRGAGWVTKKVWKDLTVAEKAKVKKL